MDKRIEQFLRHIANELALSDNTVAAYRRDLLQWERYATGGGAYELRPEETSASDLRLWISTLARDGVSALSLRRKVQALRAFFRYLMKCHGLVSSPADDLVMPRAPKPLPVYVKPCETERMLDDNAPAEGGGDDEAEFESARNSLMLAMLYETGIRCTELVELLDVNVDTSVSELKVRGKRNKDRIVPFGPGLGRAIDEYRRLRASVAGTGAEAPGGRFFVRKNGEAVYRKLVYNVVHRAMSESGVHAARMSPHVLRHSFATDMLNGGASLTSVQQLLGHQSLATTQVYTHISYRELKQNYQLAHPRALKTKGGSNHGTES